MKTDNIRYSRHIYKMLPDQFKTQKCYKLIDITKGVKILPEIVRIEDNRGFNKSTGAETWLKIKDSETWDQSTLVTGLRPTPKQNVFEGNKCIITKGKIHPESLIIIQYSKDFKTAVIDFFNGFYPYNKYILNEVIVKHQYYIN